MVPYSRQACQQSSWCGPGVVACPVVPNSGGYPYSGIYKITVAPVWRLSHRIDSDYFFVVFGIIESELGFPPPQERTSPHRSRSKLAIPPATASYCIATFVERF